MLVAHPQAFAESNASFFLLPSTGVMGCPDRLNKTYSVQTAHSSSSEEHKPGPHTLWLELHSIWVWISDCMCAGFACIGMCGSLEDLCVCVCCVLVMNCNLTL